MLEIFPRIPLDKPCLSTPLSMQVFFTKSPAKHVSKNVFILFVKKAMSVTIKLIILLMQGGKWNFVERDSWWVPSRAYRDPPLDTLRYTTLQCTLHLTILHYTTLHYAETHYTTLQCNQVTHEYSTVSCSAQYNQVKQRTVYWNKIFCS